MSRKFPENLLTGYLFIDRQHQELYARIDDLLETLKDGASKEKILEVLRYLDEYTIVHFDFEETAMEMHRYPQRFDHAASHMALRDGVATLMKEVQESQGATPELREACQRIVVDALLKHIAEHDMLLAPFLAEKNPEGSNL